MKDNVEPEVDRSIADHVLKMHQFRMSREDMEDEEERMEQMSAGAPMYEKGLNLHGKKLFTIPFIKKYITRAKSIQPTLAQDAVEKIAEEYKEIRLIGEAGRTLPVTVRTLETIIRLATAHAKCRMASSVTASDVDVAVSLMKFALYSEKDTEPYNDDDNDTPMGDDGVDHGTGGDSGRDSRSSTTTHDEDEEVAVGKRASDGVDSSAKRQRAGDAAADRAAAGGAPQGGMPAIASERRYQIFQNTLAGARGEEMDPSMSEEDALRAVGAGSAENFTADEMQAYLSRMVEENMLMRSRGKLFFV